MVASSKTKEIKEDIKKLAFEDNSVAQMLFGQNGENLKRFSKKLGIDINTRGADVTLRGEGKDVAVAERLLLELYAMIEGGRRFVPADMDYALQVLLKGGNGNVRIEDIFKDTIYVSHRNKQIAPKSLAQKKYVDYIREKDMVFAIGPAGTGKTYLAMASAVAALANKEVERIILTRPAVEAGESLGYLPGDLAAKVDPYLRPLYDALHDMMEFERAQELIEKGVIEVAPLAFMRGRTLNNSFVILDEAQNTSLEQMKMFLTRLGFGSKVVVTGDITQIDLPLAKPSGLVEVQSILNNIDSIRFVKFTDVDVVRHPLVQEVIRAFERARVKKKPGRIVEEV